MNVENNVQDGRVAGSLHRITPTAIINSHNENSCTENSNLSNKSDQNLHTQSNLVHATRYMLGMISPLSQPPHSLNVPTWPEDNQVLICGFVELEDDTSFISLAYVLLRAVYPALGQDDIRDVQVVCPRGGWGEGG